MNINIELASTSDRDAVLEARASAIIKDAHSAMSESEVYEWAGKDKTVETLVQINAKEVWVARSEHEGILGWVRSENDYVEGMYVSGKHQKIGLGRTLLSFIEKQIEGQGYEKVHLEAALNAVGFYKACGYTESAVNKQNNSLSMEKTFNG